MNRKILSNIGYVITNTWKKERRILLIIFLQVIIGVLVPLISIYLPASLLAEIMNMSELNKMFINLGSLIFALTACNFINAYINEVYETHLLNNKISYLTELFRKKMELDYSFIESGVGQNMYQSAMSTLLNDNQGISGMLRILGSLLSSICNIVLYLGIIANLEIEIVVILSTLSLIHFMILRKVLKKQHSKKNDWIEIDRKINYLTNHVQQPQNIKDIKMYSMENWLSKIAEKLIKERIAWAKKLAQYDLFIAISDMGLLMIRDGLAYFFIFRAIFNNEIEISQFIFYFGAITSFSVFINDLTSSLAYVTQKSREIDDITGYLEKNDVRHEKKTSKHSFGDEVRIELVNVYFRHNEEGPYILKNINLKIDSGEKIALVGENGAGKTTLIKLICGLYTPTEGQILINGIDIKEISQVSLGKIFAIVFQDINILPLSVAENIAFENTLNQDDEIEDCIEKAGLGNIFPSLNTPVTKILHKDGIVLSGGQQQKLALARALYKIRYQHAGVLVLDEPTAALDSLAENQLYESYNDFTQGRTSIFISHRLASTQFCHRIIMLDFGEIIETGIHSQLLERNGKYKELYEIQSKYYK